MPSPPEISTFARAAAREAIGRLIAFIESAPSTWETVFDAQESLIAAMPESSEVTHAALMESTAAYDLLAAAFATLYPQSPGEPPST